jgi:hypothetical protein
MGVEARRALSRTVRLTVVQIFISRACSCLSGIFALQLIVETKLCSLPFG